VCDVICDLCSKAVWMGGVYRTRGRNKDGKQIGKTILNTKIILTCILKKYGMWVRVGFVGFRPGKGGT